MPQAERARTHSEKREGNATTQQINMPNVSAGLGGGVTEPSLCVQIIHLEGYQFENRGGFEHGAKISFQKRRSKAGMNMVEAIERPFTPWSI